jgi:hypothetical protein
MEHADYRGRGAEPATKQIGSTSMERHRSSYKRTVLPKSLHKERDIRNFESGWRSFEHVKKFEPMIPQNSGFLNRVEVYPHAHAFDSSPLTPPISPAQSESRVASNRNSSKPIAAANVSRPFIVSANKALISQRLICSPQPGIRSVKPPRKNIFNSSTQTTVKPVRAEKRTKFSHKIERDEIIGREAKCNKEQIQGDLQCILEAINIIENKENTNK